MSRLRSILIPTAIWAVWLASMIWLVRFEAFSHIFTHSLPGYRILERANPIVGDWWMKILMGSEPVGFSHTKLDFNETDPVNHYQLWNETALSLNVMGEAQYIRSTARLSLDMLYQVQQFLFHYASGPYSLRIVGRRTGAERFDVELVTPAGRYRSNVQLPEGTVIADLMPESGLVHLRPGQSFSLRTFNPTTLSSSIVKIRALRYDEIRLGQETVTALVVRVNYEGMETLSWLDSDGRVLRQETPFGLTLVACSPQEAAEFSRRPASDIMGTVGVPTEGSISCPRSCRSLTVRLSGLALDPVQLSGERCKILSTNGAVRLRLAAERPLESRAPMDASPPDLGRYLQPSPFIQVDDPGIRDAVARIVPRDASAIVKVRQICDWVYTHVQKVAASSVPSAADVLRTLKGDCNEHTYLFVALARAAGVPAKVLLGLAYSGDGFYYHAWPAVYLDGWHELDPTFGQHAVDATHLALTEGEGPAQLRLLAVIGRIHVMVEDYECSGTQEDTHDQD